MLQPDDAAVVARDPGLPGLATLLDPEALLARLTSHPALRAEAAEVAALRYTPGVSAIATLRLHRGDEVQVASAHAWAREAPALTRAGPDALILADERLVICPLADDLRLKTLKTALDAASRADLLERLSVAAPSGLDSLEVLSYRPQRRFTARCSAPAERAVVLKLYRAGGFRRAALRQRWRREQTGLAAQICLGDSERDHCVALAWQAGRPLATRLREGESSLRETAEACALRLLDLHRRAAPALPELPDPDAEAHLEARLRSLATLDPELFSEARALLERPVPKERASTHRATLHGDFHAKQVLTSEEGVMLLDLDDACRGEPERDLACFSAHLLRDAAMQRVAPEVADAIDARFQAAYAGANPAVSAVRVRALTSRLLLGMATYPFRVRHPQWRSRAAAIVARARTLAAS